DDERDPIATGSTVRIILRLCSGEYVPNCVSAPAELLLDPPRDHLPRARARRRRHDPLALHALDHARRAVVADAQPALQPGDRRLPVLGPQLDGHVVHLVGEVLALVALALLVVAALEQLHLVARLLLALDEVDDAVDVGVGDEGAVEPLDARGAGG